MNDILDFIDELKELQELYHSGDLRDFDFNTKIQKYERMASDFESAMEAQHRIFQKSFYAPVHEV